MSKYINTDMAANNKLSRTAYALLLPLALLSNKDNENSSTVDVYRFVPYIGYKFTDNIILNTEIEFEHGGVADGNGGEVIVEFMYLDFLLNKELNIRIGNFLVPVGTVK